MPRAHDWKFLAVVGNRLAETRSALNLSQGQVARRAKITAQQLSRYELGLSDPPLSTLVRIAKVLGISAPAVTALLVQTALLAEQDRT